MTGPGCLRVGALLERRRAGISERERLVIEDHVAGCVACRDDARLLSGIVALAEGVTESVGAAARERALRRSLDAAGGAAREPSTRRWAPLALGAALVATAAGVAFFALRSRPAPSISAPTLPADRVEAGQAKSGGATLPTGSPVPTGARLVAGAGTRFVLAQATVTVERDAELSYEPSRDRIVLVAGALRVTVDPAPRRRFVVETAAFTAEVVGTELTVDLEGVHVHAGVVRVVGPDGAVLAAELRAGDSWRLARAEAPSVAPEPVAEGPPAAAVRPARAPDPGESLARARVHLAAKRPDAARQAVAAALAAGPSRREEAEARTLLAECAQAEGDHAEAARLYRAVAERYPELPAGENALFAAARAEARAGRPAEAGGLYRAYLERYPEGRFAGEAARRLRELDRR